MFGSNPYNAYKQNSVGMASKEQLLLMLLDGAVKSAKLSKLAIQNKNIEKAHRELTRVQDIFTELLETLDMSAGDFTEDLVKLYTFCKDKAFESNIKKDVSVVEELIPVIEDIRDMWYAVNEELKKSR